MIFADKLINLRKKSGMSQEEFADKLGVSRQSVSKWEGAQSIPDINKIIEMSNIFGVSTDYLLKDDLELPEEVTLEEKSSDNNIKKVSLEDASNYVSKMNKARGILSLGVGFCITSPVVFFILTGLSELKLMSETLAVALGIISIFLFVAIGVFILVKNSFQFKEYEFLEKESFETEYGVTGLIKEKKKNFTNHYNTFNLAGITTILLSLVPFFVTVFVQDGKYVLFGLALLLFLIAVGVYLITVVGYQMGAYNKLLEESDYSKEEKNSSSLTAPISAAYWLAVTAGFLLWSFLGNSWHISWVVYAVAGILYPIIPIVCRTIKNRNK